MLNQKLTKPTNANEDCSFIASSAVSKFAAVVLSKKYYVVAQNEMSHFQLNFEASRTNRH